jgi:UDP-glucose 4-epimerase
MFKSARSILVTGGAGFVGSSLIDALLERCEDARITVLDNLFNGHEAYLPKSPRVSLVKVDLRDRPGVMDAIDRHRPEVVFHLAALHYIPYCDAHPSETLEVNVIGTQNLLDACRKAMPSVLVAVSTVAVYPVRDEPNPEDSPTGPVDIYGLSKYFNEKQVELYARQASTRCAVARLANVYGPRETNPHVIPEIIRQMLQGSDSISLGNVKPRRDYIYVTDVARGLMSIAAGNDHPYRVYNVGTGREYSVEEIIAHLVAISGRPLRVAVDPERVRATDRMHLVCDLRRIGEELGWAPEHSIRSGLTALWESALAT